MKRAYINDEQEALIIRRYPAEAKVSFQYALDCLLADALGQPPPELGVKRMAESKRKPEEELSRSGKYRRLQRKKKAGD